MTPRVALSASCVCTASGDSRGYHASCRYRESRVTISMARISMTSRPCTVVTRDHGRGAAHDEGAHRDRVRARPACRRRRHQGAALARSRALIGVQSPINMKKGHSRSRARVKKWASPTEGARARATRHARRELGESSHHSERLSLCRRRRDTRSTRRRSTCSSRRVRRSRATSARSARHHSLCTVDSRSTRDRHE